MAAARKFFPGKTLIEIAANFPAFGASAGIFMNRDDLIGRFSPRRFRLCVSCACEGRLRFFDEFYIVFGVLFCFFNRKKLALKLIFVFFL